MKYLIPVEIAMAGKFPTEKLLKEYELEEYKEVVEACLRGDMESLEEAIQTNMDLFIHSGVSLIR